MALIRWYIVCVLLLCSSILKAQDPAYISIGREELDHVEIYDIHIDQKQYVWLATDEGLYRYNGYDFKHYSNKDLKSRSLFGFTESKSGQLLFHNLSGQILTVNNDSLEIYFTIPDSLISSHSSMRIDDDNNLYMVAERFIRINPQKELKIYKEYKANSFAMVGKVDSTIYFINHSNNMYKVSKKGDSLIHLINKPHGDLIRNVLKYKGKLHLLTSYKPKFYIYEDSTTVLDDRFSLDHLPINIDRFVVFPNGERWLMDRAGGAFVFDADGNQKYNGKKVLEEFIFGGYVVGPDGSWWFPTLGKGIILVPPSNAKSYRYQEFFHKNRPINFSRDSDRNLYFFSDERNLKKLDKNWQHKKTIVDLNQRIQFFKFMPSREKYFYQYYAPLVYHDYKTDKKTELNSSLPAIKDVHQINDSIALIACNVKLEKYNLNTKAKLNSWPTGRTNLVTYDSINNRLWYSSMSGLHHIKNDSIVPLETKNQTFYPSSLAFQSDTLWVGTSEKGLIRIEGTAITHQFNTENGLLSNKVNRVKVYNNLVFVSHSKGIQFYDTQKDEWTSINKSEGLSSNLILNFQVYGDSIDILMSNDFQTFNYKRLFKNKVPPHLQIESFKASDRIIKNLSDLSFSHTENQIEINYIAHSYRHQGQLKYAYQLIGLDSSWTYLNYTRTSVKFFSLSDGSYTFRLKAINENGVESEIIEIPFEIAPPFWRTWWFIVGIILVSIFITYISYQQQLKRNQHKHELHQSKLTALKSQMNPHFIFNALNSIQDLILKEEVEKSYDYITKFANLVRRTLNYSEKDFIDIEDEIALLSIYLDLEKLRFKDSFEHTLECFQAEDIQIPPMIIQPFVENAIKHGLLHKEGIKKLDIIIQKTDILTCTIIDNGIGREKAREIRERQKAMHESFSLKAIRSRFEILQAHYKKELGITINDLYENGKPTGTQVILRIPYRTEY